MTDIKVISTHKTFGTEHIDPADLAKKIEELMSEGFEITHAQNDYIIFMRSFSREDQIQYFLEKTSER